ncbi:hypothetical protein M0R45_025723 [Rubus argutus]|uniref:Uncharacterized protein n=1 Tax=Rubus argutus TaxID=59490 RepID=A0AAW1WX91_RUBAR
MATIKIHTMIASSPKPNRHHTTTQPVAMITLTTSSHNHEPNTSASQPCKSPNTSAQSSSFSNATTMNHTAHHCRYLTNNSHLQPESLITTHHGPNSSPAINKQTKPVSKSDCSSATNHGRTQPSRDVSAVAAMPRK